ncbi:TetR family transcriptional regulator [Lentibacillus populi]|uniref:TetR family transcriptional regulator n=1 Tax=Lentibacillus populi TaxID=1827502 RepID=A0A9W5TWY3_9BACI|nr:TetR/AcrR family transcriptional regulator [Lentibacillus populi]MBT2214697.1 TetR/AcrR family transcriptional regulator [Virgibacillus dakarensis]GGB38859.1 TetR family transcriptional regulator [Lentibacillus populi]
MVNKDLITDRRVRRTKKLLKQAFIELMYEKSYEQITVTDIVDLADYNRATFYRHYNQKEDIVKEIIADQTNGLIKAFKIPYKKNNYIHLKALAPSEIIIFNYILENKYFYELWREFETIPWFYDTYLNSITRFIKLEISLITPYQDGLDNNMYASFYAYGILGIILDWIKNDFVQSPDYMAEQLCKILNYYPAESFIMSNS